MPSPEALDELTASLQRLGRLLASRQATSRVTTAAKVDVTQQGAAILRTLLRHGRSSMASVASAASMDLAAVSRQIRPLEEMGAVRRTADPGDRRVSLVELTAKGRKMAEGLRAVGVRHLEVALADWSEADGRTLAALLDRFVADLQGTPVPTSRRQA